MHFYRVVLLAVIEPDYRHRSSSFARDVCARNSPSQQQRAVEEVDIIGNRRLRKEDILYYIQTRAGDPYNAAQVERDLQTILSLGLLRQGRNARLHGRSVRAAACVVIFEVRELPIIRDIQFEGLKSVAESDVLKTFRERRVGVSKESHLRSGKGAERRARSQGIAGRQRPSECRRRRQRRRQFRKLPARSLLSLMKASACAC